MKNNLILDEKALDFFMCLSWIFAINGFSSFRHLLSERLVLIYIIVITIVYVCVFLIARSEGLILRIKISDLPWCSLLYAVFIMFVYCSQFWATALVAKTDVLITLRQDFAILLCIEMYFGVCKKETKLPLVYVIAMLGFGIIATVTTPVANWGSARGYGGITTVNRNMASYIFVIAFGMCIYLAEQYGSYMYALGALFVIFSLITGSRKGIIEIALTVFIYILLKENTREKVRVIVLLSLLGIIGLICFFNIPFLKETYGERMLAIFDDSIEDSSRDYRDLLRINAFNAFLNRPWIGNGVDYASYINAKNIGIGLYSHCNYVELLCNYGIIGFCLYYSMYFFMIVKSLLIRMNIYSKMVLTCLIPLIVIEYGQITYYIKIGTIPIMILFIIARYGIYNKVTEG